MRAAASLWGNMRLKAAWPLRRYLVLLVTVTLLPAVLLTGWFVWENAYQERIRTDRQAIQFARNVGAALDQDIKNTMETLTALVTSPLLAEKDFKAFHAQASAALKGQNLHALLRAPNGDQIINTRVSYGSELPKGDVQDIAKVFETAKQSVSDLIMGSVAKNWVLGYSIPVVQNGKIAYALTMSVDLDHIRKLISTEELPPGWIVSVLDKSGRIVARSKQHSDYVGRQDTDLGLPSDTRSGVDRVTNAQGDVLVRGYNRIRSASLTVATFVPATIIDEPLMGDWIWYLAASLAVFAAAVNLAALVSQGISYPICQAAAAAARIGRGEIVKPEMSGLREANAVHEALSIASHSLISRARALEEEQARFKSVFEQAAVGFEQVGLDGLYLGLNQRLCTMMGYNLEECLGKPVSSFKHPDDIEAEEKLLSGLIAGKLENYTLEKRLLRKSGEPIWVRVTSSLVKNADGAPLYVISAIEDVTEARNAQIISARLASVVQASQDALISIHADGTIQTWNPAGEKLFGFTSEEAVGQNLTMLVKPGDKSQYIDDMRAVLIGVSVNKEVVRLRKDGSDAAVAMTMVPIFDSTSIASVSITMRDIRDRKAREHQVEMLNRELAHRVKNSLAVVQSIANQTLQASRTAEEFKKSFQGRLQSLAAVNDLLTQPNWTGTSLSDLIDLQLQPLAKTGSQHLIKNGPHLVLPAELTVPLGLALHELGTNAIKYGAWSVPNGKVAVSCHVESEGRTETLTIRWQETGGPAPQKPSRSGFGTTLIDRGIPQVRVERTYDPEGFGCTLVVPLSLG